MVEDASTLLKEPTVGDIPWIQMKQLRHLRKLSVCLMDEAIQLTLEDCLKPYLLKRYRYKINVQCVCCGYEYNRVSARHCLVHVIGVN